MQEVVIITDLGSVDPDDILALLMLPHLTQIKVRGIIATHFFAKKRAEVIDLLLRKLGCDIPVYVGEGISWGHTYEPHLRQDFELHNEGFPQEQFGLPQNICEPGTDDMVWYPKFLQGFYDYYDSRQLSRITFPKITGSEFLIQLLQDKMIRKEEPVKVICLGPMHDLALIPTELYPYMQIWAMGGGMEQGMSVPRAGYNFGIAPSVTQTVLDKVSQSGQHITVISSGLITRSNLILEPQIWSSWLEQSASEDHESNLLSRAIMQEWIYNTKYQLKPQRLSDPVTLYLALYPEFNAKWVNMSINLLTSPETYSEIALIPEDNLIQMVEHPGGNVCLVDQVPATHILRRITEMIQTSLGFN